MVRRLQNGWFIACLIACVFAAISIWLGLWRYAIYRAGVDDGIFTQVVNSIGGCFCSTAEDSVNHMLIHFSPVLLIAYPFVKGFGDARGLIVLQSIAVALTALPLYGIARRYLDERRAALITGVAMLYPALWAETFTDFHENAFVPALSAALAWAIAARNWRCGLVATLALLCVKEDQFVLLAAVGIIVALTSSRDRGQRFFGLQMLGLAVAIGLAYFALFRPAMHSTYPYLSLHFYDWHSQIPTPLGYVGATSPERLYYLFWAFLPLLFLPFGSRLLLLAIPGFLELLLSRERITMVLGTHYSMVWSGYVVAAFVDTASRLMRDRRFSGSIVPSVAALASLSVLWYHDPMARWYYLYRKPNANDARLNQVISSLPPSASIGASDEIFAHIGMRSNAYPGPKGEYYVADAAQADPTWLQRDKPILDKQIQAGTFRIVTRQDGIIVAQRVR